ncbi:hypothetical protein [Yoonia sp. SS1-5]|uniref:Uncharacterized protein n=1 Tax=Yoonia rhodophyticola TaxID=3137370 RepID=A0AAN0NJF7_9RHOB
MTRYLITFSVGQDSDVSQDALHDILGRLETVRRDGGGYHHRDGASFVPKADGVSFDLAAEDRPLFAALSDIYAALHPQKWGMSFALLERDDLQEVTLFGGLSIEGDGIFAGQTKYVATDEVLISVDVFVVTWPRLFVRSDDEPVGADGDITYDTVSVPSVAPLLFSLPLLAVAANQDQEELIVILPDANLSIEAAMGGIIGTDAAEQIDDGHLMLVDPDGETKAEALTFNSNRGPVIELRIQVPDRSSPAFLSLLAKRIATVTRAAALLVVEEDFETFTFDVRPVQHDGALGPAERIIFDLD